MAEETLEIWRAREGRGGGDSKIAKRAPRQRLLSMPRGRAGGLAHAASTLAAAAAAAGAAAAAAAAAAAGAGAATEPATDVCAADASLPAPA